MLRITKALLHLVLSPFTFDLFQNVRLGGLCVSPFRGLGGLLFALVALPLVGVGVMSSCRHHHDELEPDEPEPERGRCGHQIIVTPPEKNFTLSKEAGSSLFYIEADASENGECSWTISIDSVGAKWVHLITTSGTGDAIVEFDYDENEGAIKRSARLTITDADSSGLERQLLIRQSTETNATMTGTMEAKHGMGYGYDVTGYYASDRSYGMKPIIDYNKAVNLERTRGISIITEDYRHIEEVVTASGNTYTELASTLTGNDASDGRFWGVVGTCKDIKNFSRTKKRNDQIAVYVRLNEIVSSRTVDMGTVKALIKEDPSLILSDEFLKDLRNTQSRGQYVRFLRNYGTHFIVSADLGGSISIRSLAERDSVFTHTEITTKAVKQYLFYKKESTETTYDDKVFADFKPSTNIEVEGGTLAHQDDIHGVDKNGAIRFDAIKQWQQDFKNDDGTLNGDNIALVGKRLIPLYELVPDAEQRATLREYTIMYIQGADKNCLEMCEDEGWENYSSSDLSTAFAGNMLTFGMFNSQPKFMLAKEIVPAISKEKPVVVAYPMVGGKPYLAGGLFVGDSDHRPGRVRWYDNQATYLPNDSVCRTDSRYASLFDANGQLKRIYYYYNDLHIEPSLIVKTYMGTDIPFQSGRMSGYVKIGRKYWQRTPDYIAESEQARHGVEGDHPLWESYCTTPQRMDIHRLPTLTDCENMRSIVTYDVLRNGAESDNDEDRSIIGTHWWYGLYAFDTSSPSYPITTNLRDAYYLPVNRGDVVHIVRLSESNNTPCYPCSVFTQTDNERVAVAPIYVMGIPEP